VRLCLLLLARFHLPEVLSGRTPILLTMHLITIRAPNPREHLGPGQRADRTQLREPRRSPTGRLEVFGAVRAAVYEDRKIRR
jgi:hypothetical protein